MSWGLLQRAPWGGFDFREHPNRGSRLSFQRLDPKCYPVSSKMGDQGHCELDLSNKFKGGAGKWGELEVPPFWSSLCRRA